LGDLRDVSAPATGRELQPQQHRGGGQAGRCQSPERVAPLGIPQVWYAQADVPTGASANNSVEQTMEKLRNPLSYLYCIEVEHGTDRNFPRYQPSCSAVEFGAASDPMAADGRRPASETRRHPSFFFCRLR